MKKSTKTKTSPPVKFLMMSSANVAFCPYGHQSSHSKHTKLCLLNRGVEGCTETQAYNKPRVRRVNDAIVPKPEQRKEKHSMTIFTTNKFQF